MVEIDKTLHDEWLEEFESHLLRKTTLVQLKLRSNDDDRATGVIDALSEQVLTETTLLSLEHVGERLQRTVTWARYWATTATVIEERIDSFLKHALLVIDDDLRSTEIKKALQTVVAVDHATIKIVEI